MKKKYFIVDFETNGVDDRMEHGVLPIEIGLVVTDISFKDVEATMDRMIYFPDLIEEINGEMQWKEQYQKAAEFHKITAEEYHSYNDQTPEKAVNELGEIIRNTDGHKYQPVLVSDNPYFEHKLMKKLFRLSDKAFPFHYNTYGVGMLYELFNIKKHHKPHRAYQDAKSLFHTLKELHDLIPHAKSFFEKFLGDKK